MQDKYIVLDLAQQLHQHVNLLVNEISGLQDRERRVFGVWPLVHWILLHPSLQLSEDHEALLQFGIQHLLREYLQGGGEFRARKSVTVGSDHSHNTNR